MDAEEHEGSESLELDEHGPDREPIRDAATSDMDEFEGEVGSDKGAIG